MFLTPRDGDMLTNAAGICKENGLETEVLISADEKAVVSVNGQKTEWNGTCHAAKIQAFG